MSATLTVKAPEGAHFELEEIKTAHGKDTLGEVPILIWDSIDAAVAHYGEDGLLRILDGTSARVVMQSIARRMRQGKDAKTNDQIAQAQLDYKPGEKKVGESTPTSRAKRAAADAASKVDGDKLAAFLKRLADGDISEADLDQLIPA